MGDDRAARYWINTVSLDHVRAGVSGGFTQADHGKDTRLRHLARGDWLVFYSPRSAMKRGEPLQQFTVIGTIDADEPFQVAMSPTFHPWRLAVNFHDSRPADARSLIDDLDFISDKRRWGFPFRRGLFSVERSDFAQIAIAMGVDLD